MVLLEKLKDEIEIVPTTPEHVHSFILKHYLQTEPTAIKKVYGIIHKPTNEMIGMAIYGLPMMTATKFLQPEAPHHEVFELKRLFIKDRPGLRNIESYVIARTLKMIKEEFPDVKVVITFADDRAGHLGGIYQATNAIYLGKSPGGKHKYAYILRGNIRALQQHLQSVPYPKKEN